MNYADCFAGMGHTVRVYVSNNNFFRRRIANLFNLEKPSWIKNFKPKIIRVGNFSVDEIDSGDILLVSDLTSAEKALSLPAQCGKKVHLIQHDEGMYHADQVLANKIFKSREFKKICVSGWLKEVLKNKYGVDSELILNTLDRNTFRPVAQRKNDSIIRILMLHHKYEWKGTDEGVKIVESLKIKYPNIKLIMFGAREKQPDCPADEYYYQPRQEKLAELYSSCDIFLCPSWDEGFGLPSLEAMACKCAVATYDNGGSRDFAFDEKTALVAKRRDENDLKNKLEILIKDEVLRKKIAQAGYDFVQDMATWQEQTRKLEKILLNL